MDRRNAVQMAALMSHAAGAGAAAAAVLLLVVVTHGHLAAALYHS